MNDRQKRFIEGNFTKILGLFLSLGLSGLVFPLAFRHVEEESLLELKGHLANLETHFGITPEKNTFEFTVDEIRSKTFLVSGLRPIDQSILTNNESPGSWMTFSVERTNYRNNDSGIRVFQLSTSKNTYLTAKDSALTAMKERLISVMFVLTAICTAFGLFLALRKSYRAIPEDAPPGNLDELLVLLFKNPISTLTGLGLVLILLYVIFLPTESLLYLISGTFVAYFIGIFWIRTRAAEDPWLSSVITRDQQRQSTLSERLKTALPKHVKAVEALLKKGANLNVRDAKGQTPLFISSSIGAVEAVGLLLRRGADPNLPDLLGTTPLMIAAKNGHLGVIIRLIDAKAKVNIANQEGATALALSQNDKNSPAVVDAVRKASQHEEKEEKEAARKLEEEKKRDANQKKDPG